MEEETKYTNNEGDKCLIENCIEKATVELTGAGNPMWFCPRHKELMLKTMLESLQAK